MRFLALSMLLLPAVGAAQSVETPDPAAAALASVAAKPLDCPAVERAFAALGTGGRRSGDVEAIVAARRTDAPCAIAAANAAASALRIPQAEIVAWLLRHPDALQAHASAGAIGGDAAPVLGRRLDCGLTYTGSRLVKRADGMRLVLEFTNTTGKTVLGRDLVGRVGGRTWRSSVRLGVTDEPPLGSAEMMQWDTLSGGWRDRREVKAREIRIDVGEDVKDRERAPNEPVQPGETFEEWVAIPAIPAEAEAQDIPVEFTSCNVSLQ